MPSSHLARSEGRGISLGRAEVVAAVAAVEDLVAVEDLGEVVAVGGGDREEVKSGSAVVALEVIGQHKAELTPLCQR